MPKIICADANFIVRLLSDPPNATSYSNLWRQWKSAGSQIIAPTIYCYEVTNVFHRMSLAGQISSEEAEQLLEEALNLDITLLFRRNLTLNFTLLIKDYLTALKIQLPGFIWLSRIRYMKNNKNCDQKVYFLNEAD